jgi:hypothetical protein
MDNGARKAVIDLLSNVAGLYKQEIGPGVMSIWLQALDRFTVEQITAALSAHVTDPERGQFMPKPADVIRAISGTASDAALIAWGKVIGTVRRHGSYADVVFDDPKIMQAIEQMGGWVRLCEMQEDDEKWRQKDFVAIYRTCDGASHPRVLFGRFSLHNIPLGDEAEKPLLIGNEQRALAILESGRQQTIANEPTKLLQ